jgi:hypothetical protein
MGFSCLLWKGSAYRVVFRPNLSVLRSDKLRSYVYVRVRNVQVFQKQQRKKYLIDIVI